MKNCDGEGLLGEFGSFEGRCVEIGGDNDGLSNVGLSNAMVGSCVGFSSVGCLVGLGLGRGRVSFHSILGEKKGGGLLPVGPILP